MVKLTSRPRGRPMTKFGWKKRKPTSIDDPVNERVPVFRKKAAPKKEVPAEASTDSSSNASSAEDAPKVVETASVETEAPPPPTPSPRPPSPPLPAPRSPVASVVVMEDQLFDGLSVLTDPPALRDRKRKHKRQPAGWRSRKAGLASLLVDTGEAVGEALCSPLERDLGCNNWLLTHMFPKKDAANAGASTVQEENNTDAAKGSVWSAAAWLSGGFLCAPMREDDGPTVRSDPLPRTERLSEASPRSVERTATFPPSTYPVVRSSVPTRTSLDEASTDRVDGGAA